MNVAEAETYNVRYWHKADILHCTTHVRFTPKSGLLHCNIECRLLTQSGQMRSLGQSFFDMLFTMINV